MDAGGESDPAASVVEVGPEPPWVRIRNGLSAVRAGGESDPQACVVEVRPESPWVRISRNLAIASAVASLAMAGAAGLLTGWAQAGALVSLLASASLVTAGLAAVGVLGNYLVRRHRLRTAPMALTVTPAGATLGPRSIAANELSSGTIQPRHQFYELELARKHGPPFRVQTSDVEGARRALDALGVGAASRVMTRKVMSRVNTPWLIVPVTLFVPLSFPLAVLINVAGFAEGYALLPLAWLIALSTMALGLIRTRVSIGADAVTVSWLFTHKSVPVGEVTDVDITRASLLWPRSVRLTLRGGRAFSIAVGSRGHHLFEPFSIDEECSLIAERVRDAVERAAEKSRTVTTPLEIWLEERSESPAKAWLGELRERGACTYRGAALAHTNADLLDVVGNPNDAPILRAAAAAVLAGEGASERVRIRAVADGSAVPSLRVALVAASDGDDEALAQAVVAMAKETQRAVRRRAR